MVVLVHRCIRLSLSATFLDTSEAIFRTLSLFLKRDGGKMASKQLIVAGSTAFNVLFASMAGYALLSWNFQVETGFSGSY